ncbi:hypothetical protein ScPMuIL_012357 [Solemya velum]
MNTEHILRNYSTKKYKLKLSLGVGMRPSIRALCIIWFVQISKDHHSNFFTYTLTALESSVCYGNQDLNCTRFSLECDNVGTDKHTILIEDVRFYRSAHESCSERLLECTDPDQCCAAPSQRSIIYSTNTDRGTYRIYSQCSGKVSCSGYMPLVPFGSSRATHLTIRYQCMKESEKILFCEASLSSKKTAHLLFDGRGTVSSDLSACVCLIDNPGAGNVVTVHSVDLRLQNQYGQCTLSTLALGTIVDDCGHSYDISTYGSSIDVPAPVYIILSGLNGQTGYPTMVWVAIEAVRHIVKNSTAITTTASTKNTTTGIISEHTTENTTIVNTTRSNTIGNTTTGETTTGNTTSSRILVTGGVRAPSIWVILGPVISLLVLATAIGITAYICKRKPNWDNKARTGLEDAKTNFNSNVTHGGLEKEISANSSNSMSMQDIKMRVVVGGREKVCQEEALDAFPDLDVQQTKAQTIAQYINDNDDLSNQTIRDTSSEMLSTSDFSDSPATTSNKDASSYSDATSTLDGTYLPDPGIPHAPSVLQNSIDNRWSLQKSDLNGIGEICTKTKTIAIDSDMVDKDDRFLQITNITGQYDHLNKQPKRSPASGAYDHLSKSSDAGIDHELKGSEPVAHFSLSDILSAREIIYAKSHKTESK